MRRKSRRRLSPVNGRGPEGRRSNEFSRTICCMSPTEEFIDQTILFLKLITPELIKLLILNALKPLKGAFRRGRNLLI